MPEQRRETIPSSQVEQTPMKMEPSPVRRVLLPIDNTAQSTRAFEWYLKEAKQLGDQVIFVTIIKPMPASSLLGLRIPQPPVLIGTQQRIDRQTLIDAKALCRDYVRRGQTFGVRTRVLVFVDSHPGTQVARLIQSDEADLVVLRSFEELRSVTKRMVHNSFGVSIVVPPLSF